MPWLLSVKCLKSSKKSINLLENWILLEPNENRQDDKRWDPS